MIAQKEICFEISLELEQEEFDRVEIRYRNFAVIKLLQAFSGPIDLKECSLFRIIFPDWTGPGLRTKEETIKAAKLYGGLPVKTFEIMGWGND